MKFTVSQSALAKALSVVSKGMATNSTLPLLSGVNIRNIQLYEQGVQDINRASASTLASLARPLACTIEDLME